jgi:hypothetical protein
MNEANLARVDLRGAEGIVVGTHLDGERCETWVCK